MPARTESSAVLSIGMPAFPAQQSQRTLKMQNPQDSPRGLLSHSRSGQERFTVLLAPASLAGPRTGLSPED